MPPVGYKARVQSALPGTTQDISKRAHVQKTTAHKWITVLREEGLAHIGKWERSLKGESGGGGGLKPVFVAGPGKDARPPKRMSQAEYMRRHVAKLKREGNYEAHRARMRARHTVELAEAGKIPSVLPSAFFARNP